MDNLEHLDASFFFSTKIHLSVSDRALSDVEKSFSWPVGEPVDGTAVDE
jgi:hypothetical protein